jgi:hypothetical protein
VFVGDPFFSRCSSRYRCRTYNTCMT